MNTQLTNNHTAVRKILIRYMADYTNNTSPPKTTTGGFFAIHMTGSNKVWLGETTNFSIVIKRFRHGGKMADVVERAKARGEKLELWLLTKPKQCSAQLLENELFEADILEDRKERDLSGPGKLYCIRHDASHDYFVVSDRNNTAPTTIMSNFLSRLNTMRGTTRNVALDSFVNTQAADIIKGSGFTITEIDKFVDADDMWLRRQIYIDDCSWGNNLNWSNVA